MGENLRIFKNKNSTSLTMNARLTGNIYENLMMGDLKNELQRTQGEITEHSGNINGIQNDISILKNENKKLLSYIQNYKNIIRDIEKRKEQRKQDNRRKKSENIQRLSTLVQSVASGENRTDTAIGGHHSSLSFELNRVEKLTSSLNIFTKSETIFDTITAWMSKLK